MDRNTNHNRRLNDMIARANILRDWADEHGDANQRELANKLATLLKGQVWSAFAVAVHPPGTHGERKRILTPRNPDFKLRGD